jgi:hypothetical protein
VRGLREEDVYAGWGRVRRSKLLDAFNGVVVEYGLVATKMERVWIRMWAH